jgi:protein-tyrosine phosphatase
VSFGVLFVCTGNVCRSPLAERYLLARLPAGAPVRAGSAGVRALVGEPMDPPSAQALRELGGDDRGHAARALDAGLVRAADLVLGATVQHREAVLRLEPAALHRTFTVKEFVRLAAGLPPAADPGAAAGLVAAVAGRRGLAGPVPPGRDDIGDPFAAPLAFARAAARDCAQAVDALLTLLGSGCR